MTALDLGSGTHENNVSYLYQCYKPRSFSSLLSSPLPDAQRLTRLCTSQSDGYIRLHTIITTITGKNSPHTRTHEQEQEQDAETLSIIPLKQTNHAAPLHHDRNHRSHKRNTFSFSSTHITIQHPHPFFLPLPASSFSLTSGTRGVAFKPCTIGLCGAGTVVGGGEPFCIGGVVIVGVILYPPLVPGRDGDVCFSPLLAPPSERTVSLCGVRGQAFKFAELGDVGANADPEGEGNCCCCCSLVGEVGGLEGNSSSFNGRNSRSNAVLVLPSRSHCSCCRRLACVGSICWSGGRRGSGLYMPAIQGASPSGAWEVEGRDLCAPRETGRCWAPLAVREVVPLLLFFAEEEGGRLLVLVLPLMAEVLRPPDVGVLLGTRDLGGEFSFELRRWELPGRGGVVTPSSSRTWLPMLVDRARRAYCMSSQLPLYAPLPCLLRGSGESLSTTSCGTGTEGDFASGIRDVLGLITC